MLCLLRLQQQPGMKMEYCFWPKSNLRTGTIHMFSESHSRPTNEAKLFPMIPWNSGSSSPHTSSTLQNQLLLHHGVLGTPDPSQHLISLHVTPSGDLRLEPESSTPPLPQLYLCADGNVVSRIWLFKNKNFSKTEKVKLVRLDIHSSWERQDLAASLLVEWDLEIKSVNVLLISTSTSAEDISSLILSDWKKERKKKKNLKVWGSY